MGTGKIVELLAPAKDYAHGCAAIDCGADALYVGAPAFGARAGAAVPADEIGRLCDYAHRFGAKVFVTMNTLVYESELSEAERIARDMYRAGADALIVQDAAFLRMDLPPIELHASTQMFNMDPVRARFWYEAGFTRLIVERAASLDEMRRIAGAAPGLEIEAFVHGAICVCYSGRCFMSRSMGPRSGNRGDCSQACRLPYELLDGRMRSQGRARHWLSVRDLNLSDRLEEMIDAGVGSFKIEGRAKSAYYTAVTAGAYRAATDLMWRDPEHYRCPDWLREEVTKVSHRDYTTGFLFGPPEAGQCYETGGYIRRWEVAGVVTGYDAENRRLLCVQRNKFAVGQPLELVLPLQGVREFTPEKLYDAEGQPVDCVPHAAAPFMMDYPEPLPQGTLLRMAVE